ncbi:MAG TPA: ABC transporter permease [Kofleriaceae bacterium]
MIAYALRRLGFAILSTWFIATLVFVLVAAIPADPARALLGPHATPENLARVNEHYCLDRGLARRYGCWLGAVARGDLGVSYRTERPVAEILAARAWPTVQLALAAIVLQLGIGVPLGAWAAARRRRWPDRAIGLAAALGQAAPPFVTGTALLYLLAYRTGWLPVAGYGAPGLDRLLHLILPALTLAVIGIAYYARVTRAEVGDALGEDYIRTARAKGLSERRVVAKHALRVALGPLVAIVGLDLGMMLGGAVIVESIFAWPGLGRELLKAIGEVDLPFILGAVMLSAMAIALANLVADLVMAWLDPRLRD